MLWFAFILLSLSYWKQPPPVATYRSPVVICFHFTIFVVLETTRGCDFARFFLLWFAFILLSLSYWKQPLMLLRSCDCVVICFHFTIFVVLETTLSTCMVWLSCCDLLSFYYLCRTGNNHPCGGRTHRYVVICFHFTIFVVLETTRRQNFTIIRKLWFAFILLSLSYWKQLIGYFCAPFPGCDLLSFYYLCRTGNNKNFFC